MTAPEAKIKDSRAVYDAAWSREMDPDVPSKRDTGRSEVDACRVDPFSYRVTIMLIDRSACLRLLEVT
jgi:hypothetical protein